MRDFKDFEDELFSDEVWERVNSHVKELEDEADDEDELTTLARTPMRRTLAILREYHRWARG